MYETLKRLYDEGKIDQLKLDNAIIKGWINEQQKQEITGQ